MRWERADPSDRQIDVRKEFFEPMTGHAGRSPLVQWKAAAFVRWREPDDARVSSPDL
jgi:hypothetical protein